MPTRDIVVLGGSAGSLEIMRQIVSSFPPHLPAAVFIVSHLHSRQRSHLSAILAQICPLPVKPAAHGDPIQPGHIYVAIPDRHLLLADGHIHLSRGPREGLQRPSINVTFRSAASVYGSRVIGILLSGMLDDGAAGLGEIARHGGLTIVQDPEEATFPSMPTNALQDAPVDLKLKAAEIGPMVAQIVNGNLEPPKRPRAAHHAEHEEFSGYTCPECRGPLYTTPGSGPIEFHCRVGHVVSLKTLVEESGSMQERKLYEAIVALEEGSDLAALAAERVAGDERDNFLKESRQLKEFSDAIRNMIGQRQTTTLP